MLRTKGWSTAELEEQKRGGRAEKRGVLNGKDGKLQREGCSRRREGCSAGWVFSGEKEKRG
ncbi:hypothetical protein AMTR_s00054p00198870 [Amborella trichopoda]|uniref:Uncharacterized protein n=1 Tax=Amborella trichopoda TaxID=13333 RepID=U5D7I2_AMBTC|nr:hypothetical protein AMTR_s00054p00198870 [Amborella trichopoda]